MNTIYKSTVVLIALVTCFAGIANAGSPLLKQLEDAFVALGEEVQPYVVTIHVESYVSTRRPGGPGGLGDLFDRWFQAPQGDDEEPKKKLRPTASGSGFIYDKQGHVITNNHVVDGAEVLTVRLWDETEYKAKVVGTDPDTDLAVIKIEANGELSPAKLGDSDKLKVGQFAIAVGSPSRFDGTLTFGHISALARELYLPNMRFRNFIQTDAAINFGNSGGPLCNIDGEVIGVCTAIAYGESLGFAIPVNKVREIAKELIEEGKITRGWLGVSTSSIPDYFKQSGLSKLDDFVRSLGLPDARGAYITKVWEGTPAEKGGLEYDDVVRKIDGRIIEGSQDLVDTISKTTPETILKFEVWRNGSPMMKRIKIEEYAGDVRKATMGRATLGMRIRTITPEISQPLGLDPDQAGVMVLDVEEDSPAEKAGIVHGDVIISVARRSFSNSNEFREIVSEESKPGIAIVVRVIRQGSPAMSKYIMVPD